VNGLTHSSSRAAKLPEGRAWPLPA